MAAVERGFVQQRLPLGLRLWLFRLLERLSHLRLPPKRPQIVGQAVGTRFVWVYATTVGELNAIEAWLRALLDELGGPQLVLLSNHAHYAEAYRLKFPEALFVAFDGASEPAEDLLRRFPPELLVVAEIPCLPHDAPCRFSFATLTAAKASGAPAVLVNGWLYGDRPASRMDSIERAWFSRDYVRAFDLMLVQTDAVRRFLVAMGAESGSVFTTGNLKYDALRAAARRPPRGPLTETLAAYRRGPVIVAGSVTETEDQRLVLQAFAHVVASFPGARLVLAPRHPENKPRMAALQVLLRESGMSSANRSQVEHFELTDKQVLVLDTMGELSACYASATLAYVGTDHNVLEPLAFNRLVYVSGRWQTVYPSYPVYRQTLDAGLIVHVQDAGSLGEVWVAALRDIDRLESEQVRRVQALMAGDQGRVAPMLQLLKQAVPRRAQHA